MHLQSLPSHRLLIRPHFDASDAATALEITYTIHHPSLFSPSSSPSSSHGLFPLFTYNTFFGNIPAHPYTPDNVTLEDSLGPLTLTFTTILDSPRTTTQQWSVPRPPCGPLTLHAVIPPRHVTFKTRLGARADLRSDQGGLAGGGHYFLPMLILEDPSSPAAISGSPQLYNHIVEWDLSDSPAGTRAVWSHGEGPQRIIKTGKVDLLQSTVYMVGPVQSHPPKPLPGCAAGPGFCGIYWFGRSLQRDIAALTSFNAEMFKPMARFMRDEESTYRVFLRRSIIGFGGTGFNGSYMLEYDWRTQLEEEDSIRELFAHEMVHSWALLDFEQPDGEGYMENNAWYSEGIADWYAIILPYRFSVVKNGEEYVTQALNGHLTEYLTNPERTMTMREANDTFFDNWYSEKISYDRGCAYFCLLDWRLRKAVGLINDPKAPGPLDEIVVDLAQRRKRGEAVRQRDWFESIRRYLTPSSAGDGVVDYEKELRDILQGKLIDLRETRLLAEHNRLHVEPQRVLQYGFGRVSFTERVVQSVIAGSNADLAGLKDGDKIVDNMRAGMVMIDPLMRFWLDVERDGKAFRIEWLPREERTVDVVQIEKFKG